MEIAMDLNNYPMSSSELLSDLHERSSVSSKAQSTHKSERK